MKRSVKLTLKYVTAKKRRAINALLQAYRAAVNFYIKSLWNTPGKLDNKTEFRLSTEKTRLSRTYKQQALRQALSIVTSLRKAAKVEKRLADCPVFKGAINVANPCLIVVEEGEGSFDLVIKLSSLKKYKRIIIPTKKTKIFNKWTNKPGADLLRVYGLTENYISLVIDIPDQLPKQGKSLGVDIGINKLLSDSNGEHYGISFKKLQAKIKRKQKKSKAKQKGIAERKNFIGKITNQLPWKQLGLLFIEDLKHLKKGKKGKNKYKRFRKALISWSYRQVIEAIKNKAQEHRVYLKAVLPYYTSQTCPQCNKISKDNRKFENFCCIDCGYRGDADTIAALNILAKGLRLAGSLKSPVLGKVVNG